MARPHGIKELVPRNTEARRQSQRAAQTGIVPLEVMLQSMRRSWAIAQEAALAGNEAREMEYLSLAVKHAVDAAPFCHPKLASVTMKGDADSPLRVVIRRLTPEASNA